MLAAAKSLFRALLPATVLAAALAWAPVVAAPLRADFLTSFGSGPNQFTMTFAPIGNPGNAPDTTGSPNPAGSVGYHYNMGKYEVSRDMVSKANAAGNLGITMQDMTGYGGNGVNRPATGVSWNEAARFVNWLNTSQGYSAAYKFATQPGQAGYNSNDNIQLWLSSDIGYNPANLFRNTQARYFLPSMDEWYKAAYYDPNANGGAGGYRGFPTGSSSPPTAVIGGTAAGTAVYNQTNPQGPADITNAGGLSSYGVMGMGGNAYELIETESDLLNNNSSSRRVFRGGDWVGSIHGLSRLNRFEDVPTASNYSVGFRVASVPEPSSAALLLSLSAVGLCHRRKRLS
jgi:sulfatase modifying factor 1